jgi:pyrimidine operon attenuation protein / uracil phosphoribosyltransferase
MQKTLTSEDITAGVERLAKAISDKHRGHPIALVGIRSRGDEVAERVLTILSEEDDWDLSFGVLDISLYRDDFEHLHTNPLLQESDIGFTVEGAHIILVDDVLFTGRTAVPAQSSLRC